MRFALMLEPQQGLSYEDQLAIARRAESAGFETLFRSDHYESFPGDAGRPTTDAWAVVAGLARETERIGLGVLVSPVTFRTPGNLAKLAVTVDEMSGGRIEVGVGAGWHEVEHRRHGLDFPPIEERAERLEETLEILHGLWEGPDGWSFRGRHYTVEDAMFRPRPARDGRRRPPIIVGGATPRSYRIAARWADEFNASSAGPDRVAEMYAGVDGACRAIDRDPASIRRSAMVGVLVGRDRDELERRGRALMAEVGTKGEFEPWFEERRPRWIVGTPDEAREAVRRFADVGVERIMLQDLLPHDLEHIDLMAEALVITHTPNPAFSDVAGMLRLNDIDPGPPIVPQMAHRSAVWSAACPGIPLDTDDWPVVDRAAWREYRAAKEMFGVPALYVSTHVGFAGEPLEPADYEALRGSWARAERRAEAAREAHREAADGGGEVTGAEGS